MNSRSTQLKFGCPRVCRITHVITILVGSQGTDCIIDKIFKNIEIVKFITTALKSVMKLVKPQILVAKC